MMVQSPKDKKAVELSTKFLKVFRFFHEMKYTTVLFTLVRLVALVAASPVQVRNNEAVAGAVFVMTNSLSGNFVLASTIDGNGRLTAKTSTFTKGIGSHGIHPGGDPFFSENSMIVSGNRLFTVNAGSDTVSVFSINPQNPTELTLIGEPIPTGGDFPVSIAVSEQTGQVCVLNGGTINGVKCFKQDLFAGLVEIPNTTRSLGLTNIATPPSGPSDTTSQVLFSADGSVLYAAVKGNSSLPSQQGFIAAWSVDSHTGALSSEFVQSAPPSGGGQPFSMALIPGTNGIISPDPVLGWDVFQFDTPLSVATGTASVIPGEGAVCWVRHSPKTGNFYIGDRNTGIINEISVDTNTFASALVKQHPLGENILSDENILLDEEQIASINGNDYLYVLADGITSIIGIELTGPGESTTFQQLDLSPLGNEDVKIDPNFLAGIAVWLA